MPAGPNSSVGLGRDQLRIRDIEHHLVGVGQLLALLVDAVVVRVAREHEALRRRLVLQHPRIERRQLRIVVAVLVVAAVMQRRPARLAGILDRFLELGRVGVFLVELLEVMAGPEDEQRRSARQLRQELGVRLGPRIAHGQRIGELDLCRLVANLQGGRHAGRHQFLVVRDVFPEIAERFGGEGLAVGPLVALAQLESEDAALVHREALADVRHQLIFVVVADQACVGVGDQDAGILGVRHQHAQLAALLAELRHLGHRRIFRQALSHRRQVAARFLVLEIGRSDEIGKGGWRAKHEARAQAGQQKVPAFHAALLTSIPARTQCPSYTSTIPGRRSGSMVKGAGQADGVEALPSINRSKLSRQVKDGSGTAASRARV